jgi:hypothetical protein
MGDDGLKFVFISMSYCYDVSKEIPGLLGKVQNFELRGPVFGNSLCRQGPSKYMDGTETPVNRGN